jgi:hypothetical protein
LARIRINSFKTMPKADLRLKVTTNPGLIKSDILKRELYDIFIDLLLDLASELESGSYVGASKRKGKPSLAEGWDIIAPKKSTIGFEIGASIVNRTPAALYRVVGRGEGKFPPLEPLREWVEVKLGESDPQRIRAIAFLIGRKIANQGTNRFNQKRNYIGLNIDGTLTQDSIVREYQRLIEDTLKRI